MPASVSLQWQRLPAAALLTDGALQAEWNRLNAARRDLPFMTATAVNAALKAFGEGGEALAIARRDGQVRAMLLLTPEGRRGWRTFQPSQLPLGAWVAEAELPTQALADSLQRGPLGLCPVLSFTQVDPWLAPREEDGASSTRADYIETGWIDIAGSFDDYWAQRGKNLRQNMRKQRSKLAAEGVVVTLRSLTDAADMAGAIARYGALESAGWKASQGTAIHLDNAQGRFYRELLETAAAEGGALVHECLFDERTVAINLCVRRGDTLVVLKTTYDESIQNLSPAFLLNQDAVKAVFDEGRIRRLEYYGRLMDWHTKWTDNKRVLYHLTSYRWPLLKRFAAHRARSRSAPEPEPAALASSA